MLRLYACQASGNCFKPWLAMTQLGLPFEMVMVDVLNGEQKQPDYLAINKLGVVPFLQSTGGVSIGESNAMLWYIAEGTRLMPDNQQDRALALQWMFFEQAKLEPYISPARFFTTIVADQKIARAEEIASLQAAARPGLDRLNAHLKDRRFILDCGYSIADIAMFGYIHVMDEAGISSAEYPAICNWIAAVSKTERFRPLCELGAPLGKAA